MKVLLKLQQYEPRKMENLVFLPYNKPSATIKFVE